MNPPPALSPGSRVLFVTKFKYMGDSIVATPVFQRFHEQFPYVELCLLTGGGTATALKGSPWFHMVRVLEPVDAKGILSVFSLAGMLRKSEFDAVFLLNRSLHSAIASKLAGIPIRIGFDTEYRGPLLTHRVPYDWNRPDRDCQLDLLRAIGMDCPDSLPRLFVSTEERESAQQLLLENGWNGTDPLLAIQPGANDPIQREWKPDRFVQTSLALRELRGFQSVVFGAGAEVDVAQRVADGIGDSAIIVAGKTSLREAFGVLSHCGLWVGNDGGMLHAAVALCPATVGIFGHTKADRWGYNTECHRTVVHRADKQSNTPKDIRAGLDAITAEEVIATADSVLTCCVPNPYRQTGP